MAEGYTTISVSERALEKAKREKKPDETWDDIILRGTGHEPAQKWTEAELRDLMRDEIESYQRR